MKHSKKLEATAYHEAGHAVAAWKLRYGRPKEVSILPDEENLGHFSSHKSTSKINPDWDISTRSRLRMESCVIVNLSGRAAEALFKGRNNWVGAGGDNRSAVNYISYFTGSNEEIQAYYKWLAVRSKALIRGNWPLVEALARALLEKETIRWKEAKEIIDQARLLS